MSEDFRQIVGGKALVNLGGSDYPESVVRTTLIRLTDQLMTYLEDNGTDAGIDTGYWAIKIEMVPEELTDQD